jgi:hypothetical protein
MNTSQSTDAPRLDALPGMEDLVENIRKSECTLFVGSAVHAPPPKNSPYRYPENARPPLGSELAEKLAEKCHYQDKFPGESAKDLQRVSLCFETEATLRRGHLVDTLDSLLRRGKEPSAALKMLASLPFKIIVTTNYDQLLETALRSQPDPKDPSVYVYNPQFHELTPKVEPDPSVQHPLLFKMHGDLDHRSSIVITDEDYITFIQRMSTSSDDYHPVPGVVRGKMQEWPTLFVGYSLKDYNLRLLFRTLRWGIDLVDVPLSYSVDRSPDPLIRSVWQDQNKLVAFIAEDIWTFVPWLYKKIHGKEFEG